MQASIVPVFVRSVAIFLENFVISTETDYLCVGRVCAADARASEDVTKRWGMLNLVNQLFKIYFKYVTNSLVLWVLKII